MGHGTFCLRLVLKHDTKDWTKHVDHQSPASFRLKCSNRGTRHNDFGYLTSLFLTLGLYKCYRGRQDGNVAGEQERTGA
jgi:hypothetical protein